VSAEPSYAEASRALLRERLFAAATELLREQRWSEITMADVATGAGVSRQTLYNEFGSREDFAQAFLIREADMLIAEVDQGIQANEDDPRAALAAAFEVFLSAASQDPLIKTIADGDGSDGLLPLVTVQGGPVLGYATDRLAKILEGGWTELDAEHARLVAEPLVRLAITYVAMPTAPAATVAANAAAMLGPYLEQLLQARVRP
jgi:AcrR family transcriptional regulator